MASDQAVIFSACRVKTRAGMLSGVAARALCVVGSNVTPCGAGNGMVSLFGAGVRKTSRYNDVQGYILWRA